MRAPSPARAPTGATGAHIRAASGHHVHRTGRRRSVATAIAALLAVAVLGGVEPASLAAPAAAETALVLDSQSPAFVSTQAGVTLRVGVNSALPASRSPLEVTLYSAILDRYTLRRDPDGVATEPAHPTRQPRCDPARPEGAGVDARRRGHAAPARLGA